MTYLPSLQQFSEATQSNLATFSSAAEIALNATERLCTLNLDCGRSFFAFATSYAAPGSSGDVQAQLSKWTNETTQGLEQATEYFRKVSSVYVSAQSDLSDLHGRSSAEFVANVQAMLENLGKFNPLATGDMLETFKTAVRNSAAAYEDFVATTREVATNNLSVATGILKPAADAANASKAAKKAA